MNVKNTLKEISRQLGDFNSILSRTLSVAPELVTKTSKFKKRILR